MVGTKGEDTLLRVECTRGCRAMGGGDVVHNTKGTVRALKEHKNQDEETHIFQNKKNCVHNISTVFTWLPFKMI
jgi:hypothetical protein